MKLFSQMTVAVTFPPNPSKMEQFAGEELKKYLEKIFGQVRFSDNADTADNVFVIGGPGRNVLAKGLLTEGEFNRKVPGPEGLLYQIEGNTAVLAGSDDNGTLYAVYEFLEQELGCGFGAFGLPQVPAGEVVPGLTEKELADTLRCKPSADLPYRTAIVQFGEEAGKADLGLTIPYIDYLAKNRYNRILTWVSVYKTMVELNLTEELAKRGIRLTVGHHQSLTTFLPFEGNDEFPTAYGKEHPDFFRVLSNGRRQTDLERVHYGQWLLCSRNQNCIEEVAKNINAWLDRNPVVDTVALWPNDGIAKQCQCGLCSKYTKMENYLYFTNEVAKRLKAAHEERKVDVIVYLDLWDCPKGTQLCDNIVVDIATWTPKGLRHVGCPDGSALLQSHINKTQHDFHNAGSQTVLYEYYMGNYGNHQAVMPAADEMQSIFQYFKQAGFQGSGTQMECFNLWNNILNFYTFGRTQYDSDLSLADNIAGLTRLFGEGGEAVAEIFRIYEDTLDGQVSIDKTGKLFAETVDAQTVYDLFEKAFAQASSPLYRNNIRLLRMAFRYTMLSHTDTEEAKAEIGVMSRHFDSFTVNDPGFGIAIVSTVQTDEIPADKWYQFEA